MKLATCLVLASLSLGASFVHASTTDASCAANPGGSFATDRTSFKILDETGKEIPSTVSTSGGAGAVR